MAERRMFAKSIIDSDAFLDMPLSSQALYFHLSMRADDEGFINNPKKIQKMISASDDDMRVLESKNFIIPFESGIVVIKHWRIHNYIRKDRLVETKYTEERELLAIKENGAYTISEDIKEIETLDSTDMRKIAYKNSSLPYSFTYKIKRAFEGQICPVCGRKMTSAYKTCLPTVQHNIPISKGGLHEIENISVICESCNTSIRDKETDSLNNADVIEIWDRIQCFESNKIQWFEQPSLLWQSSDGQVTDICPSDVSIGKDRLGKGRSGKDRLGKVNKSEPKMETVYYPLDETLDKTFKDYIAMRKEIKKPMTDRAIELAMVKLEKLSGSDNDIAIAILEQSIMNSWQGLFELKEKAEKTTSNIDKWQAAADELERRRNELN